MSLSPWQDIEDNFLMCSICLDLFKEPKLLPCLHRYCKPCLAQLIERHTDQFQCPLCNNLCTIPEDGVDGYKTDFYMKELLGFVHLNRSLENNEEKECIGCSKKRKVTAYCFKCRDFLCDECCQYHRTSRLFQEHQGNILALGGGAARRPVSLGYFLARREAPACKDHDEKRSEICCGTCGNLPICIVCGTLGKHKEHKLYDVKDLARIEREKLHTELIKLETHKEKMYNVRKHVDTTRNTLKANICDKKEKLKLQYEREETKLTQRLVQNDEELERDKKLINDTDEQEEKDSEKARRDEIERTLKEINNRYDNLKDDNKTKNERKRKEKEAIHDKKQANLKYKLSTLQKESNDIQSTIDDKGKDNLIKVEVISAHSKNRITRFENIKSTARNVLTANDDWADSERLPGIREACLPLLKNMQKDFPELKSLSEYDVHDLSPVNFETDSISEHAESIVSIRNTKETRARHILYDFTISNNGYIVISCKDVDERIHIDVINTEGKMHHDVLKKRDMPRLLHHRRRTTSLSDNTAVIICRPTELRLYDVSNGSWMNKKLHELNDWADRQYVTCVAIDRKNKQVFVGTNTTYVVVLDAHLHFSYKLTLPRVLGKLQSMTVHNENLLICHSFSGKVYAATIDASMLSLKYIFPTPDFGIGHWYPLCVSTDKNGLVYILWEAVIMGEELRMITQFSADGLLLTSKQVVSDAQYLVTNDTDADGEKLLVVTSISKKIYTYGLIAGNGLNELQLPLTN